MMSKRIACKKEVVLHWNFTLEAFAYPEYGVTVHSARDVIDLWDYAMICVHYACMKEEDT